MSWLCGWLWIWCSWGWAHPMNTDLHGHLLQVYLEGDRVEVRYAAEIPTDVYIRQLRDDPAFEEQSGLEAQEAFDQGVLQDLEWGLLILADGERLDWTRLEPPGSFRKVDSRFAVYSLWLEATLPEGTTTLNVANGNIPDLPAYFSTSVYAAPEIKIEASSLLDVDQGMVIRSRSGIWLMEESQREVRLTFSVDPLLVTADPEFRHVTELGSPSGEVATDDSLLDDLGGDEPEPLLKLVTGDLSIGSVLFAILLAIVLGAAHALAPGHGKSLVAAYLLGSRRKVRHAVWLGVIVTITHTAGVYVLALVAWMAEKSFPPAQIMPWLELLSGLMILGLGLFLIRGRFRDFRSTRSAPGCGHGAVDHGHHHHHDHDHDHDHGHDHHHHHGHDDDHAHAAYHARQIVESSKGWRELVTMGVAGGLTPCPSALILLLAAISFGRLMFGLVLVAFFSLGLALVVMAVGIAVIKLGDRFKTTGRLRRIVPAIALGSALVVTGFGLWMSWTGVKAVQPTRDDSSWAPSTELGEGASADEY